jgi:hypothetical protein
MGIDLGLLFTLSISLNFIIIIVVVIADETDKKLNPLLWVLVTISCIVVLLGTIELLSYL